VQNICTHVNGKQYNQTRRVQAHWRRTIVLTPCLADTLPCSRLRWQLRTI